ncbi:hypothetical protein BY996DRAFT_6426042 [Phakopsora pachyrhizi]|uniref:Uncharacterized protein n=1 Tax=Phakopsora pachyrhizi TaxID=170000 RepID=A0AAV0BA03_PHAPC|nr:hypothetical protein BY996DRAFT_6426042 [Phakopsora pachyrhizi]CAH7681857.1 hypothetical protein PPACK8108_LOCUS14519 [Phakopsora pachyrhizi]
MSKRPTLTIVIPVPSEERRVVSCFSPFSDDESPSSVATISPAAGKESPVREYPKVRGEAKEESVVAQEQPSFGTGWANHRRYFSSHMACQNNQSLQEQADQRRRSSMFTIPPISAKRCDIQLDLRKIHDAAVLDIEQIRSIARQEPSPERNLAILLP